MARLFIFLWKILLTKCTCFGYTKYVEMDIISKLPYCQAQPSPSPGGLSSYISTKLPTPPGTSQILIITCLLDFWHTSKGD